MPWFTSNEDQQVLLGASVLLEHLRIASSSSDSMVPGTNNDTVDLSFMHNIKISSSSDSIISATNNDNVSTSSSTTTTSSRQELQAAAINNDMQQIVQVLQEKHKNRQKRKKKRRLEFVHIPKTGGTAVETTAALSNISWGVCHFLNAYKSTIVSHNHTTCPDAPETFFAKPKLIHNVPHWHLPPRYFEYKAEYKYNPYKNADLFTIVRNPYDRIMSQYSYYFSELAVNQPNSNVPVINSEATLNTWLWRFLRILKKAVPGEIGETPENNSTVKLGNMEYYTNFGHLIPQYDYVYDGTNRTIHHVIHFERLAEEFPALMKEYGLEDRVILPTRRIRSHKREITIANISLENIRRIERYYARDFAAFGYETVSQYFDNQYQYDS